MALRVFRSLHDAKAEGFETYDRSPIVFLVRRRIPPPDPRAGDWELATVQLNLAPDPKH